MGSELRLKVLRWWAGLVSRRPGWVLLIATAVGVGSVAITVGQLEIQSDRNALLSPDLGWNQDFEHWRTSFPGDEDLYVVVDSGPLTGGRHRLDRVVQAKALVDELGQALMEDEHVELAVWGFDRSRFSPRTLRLLPTEPFEEQLRQIAEAKLLLVSPDPQRFIHQVVVKLQQRSDGADEQQVAQALQRLTHLVWAIGRALETPADQRPSFGQMAQAGSQSLGGREYLASPNGRLFFIRVSPRKTAGTIQALSEALASIRSLIKGVSAKYPQIQAGLTGIDVVEADETQAIIADSAKASVIACVLIALVLVGAFYSLWTPLLAIAALLVGIAWSFGFLTLAVGHLQVLSMVFAVILLGLGVAYGIHLISRIELVRMRYSEGTAGLADAVTDSFQTVGPGILTGAITTSAAFGMTVFTDFRGVAEMGLIAAGGILLCLLAMFSVFPGLLSLLAANRRRFEPVQARRVHLFKPQWVMPFARRPRITLTVAAALTAVSLAAASQMQFDYDLMRLYPRGVDSVRWQQRITEDGGQSIWAAVSIVETLEQARQRKQQFQALDKVGEVGGIGLLFPEDESQKIQQIERVRRALGDALPIALGEQPQPSDGRPLPDLATQLTAMRLLVHAAATRQVPETIRPHLERLGRAISSVVAASRRLDGPQYEAAMSGLISEYQQWRYQTAQQIDQALDTSPLTPADVPGELLRPYMANRGHHRGGYALEIHPKLPPDDPSVDSPLDPDFLPGFIQQLEQVDPHVTGVVAQIYRSGHLIWRSYYKAGWYALAVVFVLVWLDFWSWRAAVLCLVPVAVGFAATFGVMWSVGLSIDPANIIVLPLMFGIGIDAGVHMLHRYRQDPQRRPLGLARGTGKGITITSMTTMIGFGSLMIAKHRGIAGLGFVMTTGIGLTLLACWTVVPAWLELRAKSHTSEAAGPPNGSLRQSL